MKKVIRRYKSDLKDWWQKVLDDVAWAEYDFEGGFYYPSSFGPQGDYTREEAEEALRLAKEVVDLVEKKIK